MEETYMVAMGSRTGFWNETVWASIDDGVSTSAGEICTLRKVIPTIPLGDVTSVPADRFDAATMSIEEGLTKPYVELAVEFQLTNGQVNDDPNGTAALTLAKFAAKSLALAEDLILLQGGGVGLPSGVRIESGQGSLGRGILGFDPARHITVQAPDPGAPTNSGGQILAAVAEGIARLTGDVQAPPFALIADTSAFAAIWGNVINGTPAYTVLNPVLTGGIYGTGAMPRNTGLLIALGGDPTTIYVGSDPLTEPTYKNARGRYFFRAFERLQFVVRDERAFVRLDFSYLAEEADEDKAPAAFDRDFGAGLDQAE
jgi:hypothetical protein